MSIFVVFVYLGLFLYLTFLPNRKLQVFVGFQSPWFGDYLYPDVFLASKAGLCDDLRRMPTHAHRTEEEELSPELSQLLSLQETDIEIKRIGEEIASLPARQEIIERQFAESAKEHLDLKKAYEDALAERSRLESELSAEQVKLEKFKADLMKARNEKEYSTAVREIDVAKKAITAFENELLKMMERVEKLATDFQVKSPELEAHRREVDRQLDEISNSVLASRRRLEELQLERARLHSTLGTSARAIYDRVSRLRGGVVLAEAKDYSCIACRMKIRPQVYNDIRRGDAIITCESCGRVLFYRVVAEG